MDVKIIKVQEENVMKVAPLAADFRVALKSYKGIKSTPNVTAGAEEIREYLASGFPVYAAICEDEMVGYMVCKIDEPCVWVESLFVAKAFRSKGIADKLIERAEEIAHTFGEETLYFYVHPNNHRMISFLRKHGYTVLNLIEIRKPYAGELLAQEIQVGEHGFDY